MTSIQESDVESSRKSYLRSYFALIPVFNKRKETTTERNIIKIIHKSSICESSPVLKTLLIENVRICCVVVESSGKQSVKILYASVPFIFALISRANPKFEKLLKNENISSCLKILKESDFESVLNNVCYTTIFIHRGIKKIYPTICVTMLKDSLLFSEKSLSYLLKLILHVLKSAVDFLSDNIVPIFNYLRRQNYAFATYVTENFPRLIAAVIKYSVVATFNVQKATIIIFQLFRKILSYFSHILNHSYADSALSDSLKKLCLFFKLSVAHLRSTNIFSHVESNLLHIYEISKPYIWEYFQKFFEVMKTFVRTSIPIVKSGMKYAVKETIPFFRKFIDDNFESILSAYTAIKKFLFENSHYIKSFCCYSCSFMYSLISYLYKALHDILPHVIRFSSNATISLMNLTSLILENCVYLFHILCNNSLPVLLNQKRLFCSLSKRMLEILKNLLKNFLELQPYIVLLFRIAFNELIQLIHVLSPTLLSCVYEVNSSMLYASSELVTKSCIAVKHVTPSLYCTLKSVVPHTARAASEVIKSSKNSVVIIFPAILRGVLTIRPEVKECVVVLFSDGNRACLEVIEVTYSASCHLKDAARSVSTNIPVVYKAISEVLKTTSCAAIEVSVTSINAKSRMVKDIQKAHELVNTSFTLAEQEIIAAYMEFIYELNSIIPHSKRSVSSDSKTFKRIANLLFKLCHNNSDKVFTLFKSIFNLLESFVGNSAVHFQQISKVLGFTCYHLFFFLYVLSINILKVSISKTKILQRNIQKLLHHALISINSITSSMVQYLYEHLSNDTTDINGKIVHYISVSISKVWSSFKSNVHATWIEACEMAPEIWNMIECMASSIWNFIVENAPGAWITWKTICSEMWELICDFAPYIWNYSSSITPVLWSSGRNATKYSWDRFVNISGFMWQTTVSLSSEYWMLSKTYLPVIWFAGCAETKRSWNVTCYLIENCWNLTVESCFASWNFLHRSVAKSWRRSLVITKTAYYMITTTGSVLQKSFCVCCTSKNAYVMVVEATPHISGFALNSLRVPKLSNILTMFRNKREENCSNSDALNAHSSKESGLRSNIKSYIFAIVDNFSSAEKLLSYETFMPSKLSSKNPAKL